MPVLGFARLGTARLNAFRLGYVQPTVIVSFNGTNRTNNVRVQGLTIRDYLDSQPNIATMRVDGFTPAAGNEVKIGLGSLDASALVFAGRVQSLTQVAELRASNVAWDLTCVSYEAWLNVRKVLAKYTGRSASFIVRDIITTFSNSTTTTHIEAGLDTIDEISFTNEEVTSALDRVARAIGAYWYVDASKDLHFFTTSEGSVHAITTGAEVFKPANITLTTDLSQVRTRVFCEGGGSAAAIDVAVSQTTIPVDDASWYSGSGGTIAANQQRIEYTDRHLGGTGSTTAGKTGLAPSALSAAVASGTAGNLSAGARTYKVTHVINGAETEGGTASSSATITQVASPTGVAVTSSSTTGGSMAPGGYYYFVSFYDAVGETQVAGNGSAQTVAGGQNALSLSNIPTSADARTVGRRVYRSQVGGGGPWRLAIQIANNSATTATDTTADASLGALAPVSNTTGSGQINLSSIPTGPTGTSSRRIYRTEAGGSTHKFALQISDNSTTSTTDNIADESLGAEVPSSSEVGATAGDTSLRVADTGQFNSAGAGTGNGGWAKVAGQLVRFTGRSVSSGAGTLTGIPGSGTGSITAPIPFGEPIVMSPHLVGVTGVVYSMPAGTPLNVLVQRDDAAAQAAFLALIGTGDGIVEEYLQDNRLSEVEAGARADAKLEELKDPLVTLRYETRDQTTRTGLDVTVTLGAPTSISGTFKIQSVTIDQFDPRSPASVWPRRSVEASSRRLSFEALLRLIRAT